MYSDMSMRTIASCESNMNSASARASSVLPTPVGPRKRNVPICRLGSWRPARERLEAFLGLTDLVDRLLLGLPLGLHAVRALTQLGQLALDRLAPGHGRLVLLLGQRLKLDLELHHAPLHLVDLGREGVDLDPQPGG